MTGGGGQTTQTTTSQPPPQFLAAYEQALNLARDVMGQPLRQYQGPEIAPFSPMQQQAFQSVENAQGIANPYINSAAQYFGSAARPIYVPGMNSPENLGDIQQRAMGFSDQSAMANILGAGRYGINDANMGVNQAGHAVNSAADNMYRASNMGRELINQGIRTGQTNAEQGIDYGQGMIGRGVNYGTMDINQGNRLGAAGAEQGQDYAAQALGGIGNAIGMGLGANYGNNVQNYLNPYTQDVVRQTEAQFNNQNQQQQQGVVGNAIQQGAFGGDRAAIAQGITAGQQQLAEAPVLANLEQQGYLNAQQQLNAQQGYGIQGGTSQGQLGLGSGQLGLGAGQLGVGAGQAVGQLGVQGGVGGGQLGVQGGLGMGQLGVQGGASSGQLGVGAAQGAGQLGLGAGQLRSQTGLGQAGLSQQAVAQRAQLEQAAAGQQLGFMQGQQQMGVGAQEASGWLANAAANGIGALGQEAQSSALTGANALYNMGNQQQNLLQEQYNIPYEQFQQAQAWPYQQLNEFANIAEGIGGNAGGTSTLSQPGPSMFGQVAGGLLSGVGLAGQLGAFGGAGEALQPVADMGLIPQVADMSGAFAFARGGGIKGRHAFDAGGIAALNGLGNVSGVAALEPPQQPQMGAQPANKPGSSWVSQMLHQPITKTTGSGSGGGNSDLTTAIQLAGLVALALAKGGAVHGVDNQPRPGVGGVAPGGGGGNGMFQFRPPTVVGATNSHPGGWQDLAGNGHYTGFGRGIAIPRLAVHEPQVAPTNEIYNFKSMDTPYVPPSVGEAHYTQTTFPVLHGGFGGPETTGIIPQLHNNTWETGSEAHGIGGLDHDPKGGNGGIGNISIPGIGNVSLQDLSGLGIHIPGVPYANGGVTRHAFDGGGMAGVGVGQAGAVDAGLPIGGGEPLLQGFFNNIRQLPTEKLQELASRFPPTSQQGRLVRHALNIAHSNPYAQMQQGQQITIQAPAMMGPGEQPQQQARGGRAKFGDGGGDTGEDVYMQPFQQGADDDRLKHVASLYGPGATPALDAPPPKSISNDGVKPAALTQLAQMPTYQHMPTRSSRGVGALPPPSFDMQPVPTQQQPGTLAFSPAMYASPQTNAPMVPAGDNTYSKMMNSPWAAMTALGAGMLSSRSPHFGEALGQGLTEALQYGQHQQGEEAKEQDRAEAEAERREFHQGEMRWREEDAQNRAQQVAANIAATRDRLAETTKMDAARIQNMQDERDESRQRIGLEDSRVGIESARLDWEKNKDDLVPLGVGKDPNGNDVSILYNKNHPGAPPVYLPLALPKSALAPTSAEKDVDRAMKDPAFAEEYKKLRSKPDDPSKQFGVLSHERFNEINQYGQTHPGSPESMLALKEQTAQAQQYARDLQARQGSAPAAPAPATSPAAGNQYIEGKKYVDAQGNEAYWKGGKWFDKSGNPLGGP